jgi:hypothetical protein
MRASAGASGGSGGKEDADEAGGARTWAVFLSVAKARDAKGRAARTRRFGLQDARPSLARLVLRRWKT